MTVEKNSTCGAANQLALTATDADTAAGSLAWSIRTAPATGDGQLRGRGDHRRKRDSVLPAGDRSVQLPTDFVVVVTDDCGERTR